MSAFLLSCLIALICLVGAFLVVFVLTVFVRICSELYECLPWVKRKRARERRIRIRRAAIIEEQRVRALVRRLKEEEK